MEKTRKRLACALGPVMFAIVVAACGPHAPPNAARPMRPENGVASFYGHGFAGRPTASGELFDPGAMTCAHRTLPFGTNLKVTNLGNGRSVTVRVNDRGPFAHRRLIDLSEGAARKLDMIATGTARVRIEVVPPN